MVRSSIGVEVSPESHIGSSSASVSDLASMRDRFFAYASSSISS